jgi:hypothetical protein
VIVLVAGALFAKPPLVEELVSEDSHSDTLGSDQPGKITPATPAPNDCGHPPRMHKCTGGKTRIRLGLQQNVPVGDVVSNLIKSAEVTIYQHIEQNRTCGIMENVDFSFYVKKTNGYSVSALDGVGGEVEVSASSPSIAPVVYAAKAKANARVEVTNAKTRTEEVGFSVALKMNIGSCWEVTRKVFWTETQAEATQDFYTRAICNVAGGGQDTECITDCNKISVKATADGTPNTRGVTTSSYLGECCPPPPPPPPGPPAAS